MRFVFFQFSNVTMEKRKQNAKQNREKGNESHNTRKKSDSLEETELKDCAKTSNGKNFWHFTKQQSFYFIIRKFTHLKEYKKSERLCCQFQISMKWANLTHTYSYRKKKQSHSNSFIFCHCCNCLRCFWYSLFDLYTTKVNEKDAQNNFVCVQYCNPMRGLTSSKPIQIILSIISLSSFIYSSKNKKAQDAQICYRCYCNWYELHMSTLALFVQIRLECDSFYLLFSPPFFHRRWKGTKVEACIRKIAIVH